MAVTAQLVKQLREMTGAGMMDCKNALSETDGDIDKAVDLLREKGLSKAAKKAGRIAAEGLVRLSFGEGNKSASLVEVNSETDFVAKNPEFIEFVEDVAKLALTTDVNTIEEFMAVDLAGKGSLEEVLHTKIAKIGENLTVRRFTKLANPSEVYIGYMHGAGNIGVLVAFETSAEASEIEVLGKDVAMQVASMNPKFLNDSEVDSEWLENEKEIARQILLNEGKAPEILEKIIPGKVKSILKEVCLLDQKFVKNGDITVQQYIDDSAKAIGKDIKIVKMVRYEVGEGIEKKEENFAEEVAKQMGK